MFDKELIKKNFSLYAGYYDRYSSVQNSCASKLIDTINDNKFKNILEIGCGTGNYTQMLNARFPHGKIKALDISGDMVGIARGKLKGSMVEFLTGDGELMEFEEEFDLITSNATFQWFEDLEKTLWKYRNMLCGNGVIIFSVFGPRTYFELNSVLKEINSDMCVTSCGFIDRASLGEILKGISEDAYMEEELLIREYPSLMELMRTIKYTGTRGKGVDGKIVLSRGTIDKLEKLYIEKFGKITATHQIFFCRA